MQTRPPVLAAAAATPGVPFRQRATRSNLRTTNASFVQGCYACDVADPHAMFKLTRGACPSSPEVEGLDVTDTVLCIVGAGLQAVSLKPRAAA